MAIVYVTNKKTGKKYAYEICFSLESRAQTA